MDVVFTIVSRNYAAQAATLMASLATAEPTSARVVIATDGPITFADAGIRVVDAGTLTPDFGAMCAYYDALELNTAVKPHAFRALMGQEGVGSVTYLDPDIFVYRPLDEVRAGLVQAPLVLTPHLTRPLRGSSNPNDHVILTSGAYNLGFMAVRAEPQTLALIDWWGEKLRFDCRVDFAQGLFTDQKWMDLAPGLVSDVALLRSPTLNLAYWNLEGREVTSGLQGWQVEGHGLAFFHFSGFDPSRPDLLSKHQDRIKVVPGSPLAGLLAEYGTAMLRNGHAQSKSIAYGHQTLPSGQPVLPEHRSRCLAAARAGEDFGGGLTKAAEAWLNAPKQAHRSEALEPLPGPWLGPSDQLRSWLKATSPSPAIEALLGARRDLRDRFASDPEGLRAWLVGPEALAGRFDPQLLASEDLGPAVIARAVGYAWGETRPGDLPVAAYGLAGRAGWPQGLTDPALERPVRGLARGLPFPRLFLQIWKGRGDLQRLFPLTGRGEQIAFLRWLIGGGLAEVGVDPRDLPRSTRHHPIFGLAQLSVRQAPRVLRRPQAVGTCQTLRVMETWSGAPAGTLVFDASSTRFLTANGAPARPPARVGQVIFQTEPNLAPADAIALLAHGVTWREARR